MVLYHPSKKNYAKTSMLKRVVNYLKIIWIIFPRHYNHPPRAMTETCWCMKTAGTRHKLWRILWHWSWNMQWTVTGKSPDKHTMSLFVLARAGLAGGAAITCEVVWQTDLASHVEEDVSFATLHHFWFAGCHGTVIEVVPLTCHTNIIP